jgi:predicted dinucleotide-binding enzyme
MKIGIIGAGNMGGTLARKLIQLGHTVALANSRGPETLAALATELGATAVSTADAVKDVELVIVAIPQKSIALLPRSLFRDVPEAVIVVDTGNYYPSFRDGRIEVIENGMAESRWVASQLGRPVVKVFNNLTARSLVEGGRPPGTVGRIALPVAGDDARAKAVVIDLVDALGFDGIDGGSLDESWRQQPGTPVYATDRDAEGVRLALSQADRARSAELRELALQRFQQLPPGFTHDDLVRLMRSLR